MTALVFPGLGRDARDFAGIGIPTLSLPLLGAPTDPANCAPVDALVPDLARTVARAAALAQAHLATAGGGRLDVVAHSMGAYPAECFVRLYPHLVRHCVLIDPSVAALREDAINRREQETWARLTCYLPLGARVRAALIHNWNYRRWGRQTWGLRAGQPNPVPTLLITAVPTGPCASWLGAHRASNWVGNHRRLAARLGAQHTVIEGQGHMVLVQAPELVRQAIGGFLD